MKKLLGIMVMIITMANAGRAQDPQFSQFYAIPLYLNPAFAGNTQQGRIMYIHRIQWPSIPGAFKSYAFSFDYNLPDISSGVGLMMVHDKAGSGGLRFTNIGGMYSYMIQLDRKHILRPGIHMSYTVRGIDFNNLTFGDQLIRGGASTSSEAESEDVTYMDFNTGLVFYSTRYWVGLSLHHLNRPDMSLMGGEVNLPRKFSSHIGYNFPVKTHVSGEVTSSITIAANYKAELKWDQLDLGFYYTYQPLVIGAWYRGIPGLKGYEPGYGNNDAIIALIGFRNKQGFRFGYSYDLTISRLISNTAGSHEISLSYEWASPNAKPVRNRRRFLVPCAKF